MLATQIIHWPGQDTPACDAHAAQLTSVGALMGFTVSSTPIYDEVECANCLNTQMKELERLDG